VNHALINIVIYTPHPLNTPTGNAHVYFGRMHAKHKAVELKIETKLLFHTAAATPIGRLTLSGYIHHSQGVQSQRVYGNYALVYVLEGGGHYWDALNGKRSVQAGDVILIFPDIAHTYGPTANENWDEFFCVFDGPAFDLLRAQGLLNPRQPVLRANPIAHWLPKLEAVVSQPPSWLAAERLAQVGAFWHVLVDLLSCNPLPAAAQSNQDNTPNWLMQACALLETNLHEESDLEHIAQRVGLPYETFRKHFQKHLGQSPAKYRAAKKIEAACSMLQQSDLTLHAIAAQLGFTDEFHLSRRFKQMKGIAPNAYRLAQRTASKPAAYAATYDVDCAQLGL
jgi:AraC-like DNA-binding protein